MWPFTPKWKSKDPQRRINGIENLNSTKPKHQVILAEIAKNDNDESARVLAVSKLTEQKIIADIALKDSSWLVREAAVKILNDQVLLTNIVSNSKDFGVQFMATKKLTNISEKTKNLIHLFSISMGSYYKNEIAAALKELFIHDKLSVSDKDKILQLNGTMISEHSDNHKYYDISPDCDLGNRSSHHDIPGVQFNL